MGPDLALHRSRRPAATSGDRPANADRETDGPAASDSSTIERAARVMARRIAKKSTKEKIVQHAATEQESADKIVLRQPQGAMPPPTLTERPQDDQPAPKPVSRPGAMTVDAAAHEALFKAGPKIIVAAAEALLWQGFGLPDWLQLFVYSERDGTGFLGKPGPGGGDAAPVALAVPPTDCLGLVAFGKNGAEALASCAAWFGETGVGTPPTVERLAGRTEPEQRIAALNYLLGRLRAEQAAVLERNAALHRGLSELRETHEAAQSVLFLVSDTLARHQLPPIECVLSLRPGSATVHPSGDGKQGTAVRQRLPVGSQGLAAIALHVTMGPRHGKGRLLVRLTALESGSPLISWAIPFDHLHPGWNFLEIPTVVAGPRQTVELETRWDGDLRGAPQLSLSNQLIGAESCPEVEGGPRLRHPLAMQIWTGLPGSRRVSSAFADPADLQRAILSGRQLLLSPDILSRARLMAPQDGVGFEVLSFKNDNRVLQLHPVVGRTSHAVLPAAVPPGTKRVLASVMTDNPEGPWVEYAMLLAPSGTHMDFPGVERPAGVPATVSEWLSLPPMTAGSVVLALEEPTAGICDLHIATRTPPAASDSYAWAQWKTIMIELG